MPNGDRQSISLGEAAKQLGVTRATLYYYLHRLKIETVKYQLDKKTYMSHADFERIKTLKEQAKQRGTQGNQDKQPDGDHPEAA
jgi:phage antirepressor YoqD-like protein